MQGRILLLESNPTYIAELQRELESPGHHVVITPTIYKAVQALEAGDFDLIVSDIHLETESAFDLLRTVKANVKTRSITFVFYCIHPSDLTMSMQDGLDIASAALGAAEFILMDHYDPGELCRRIEKHLPEWVERRCDVAA
jgi:CheY-like chemotaxis protein